LIPAGQGLKCSQYSFFQNGRNEISGEVMAKDGAKQYPGLRKRRRTGGDLSVTAHVVPWNLGTPRRVNKALMSVDFVRADDTHTPGLVPVKKDGEMGRLSVDEQAAIWDASLLRDIDYVFFRRFSDGRSSQVAAYVVDNAEKKLSDEALSKLHQWVWLQGTAPLLYVAGDSRIDLLACARGPDFWDDKHQTYRYNPFKTATEVDTEIKRFSAFRLADGTFWDEPANRHLACYDKAAHQLLIQAVVEADKDIKGSDNPLLRRLLLLVVLIKYLEDRDVFPKPAWFGQFHTGARSFFDVLKGGDPKEVHRLLDFLAGKFNGDVFDLSLLRQRRLTKSELTSFANLVEARTIQKQRYLWDQYSFKYLPVEVISNLYQRFVKDGHGAVYTPPFLAALLLDHCMPYGGLTGKERILDPACGSGVFLVGAFRRLINHWRSQHTWRRPSVGVLKKILRSSIHGVDIEPNAIDLTAFSLSLAICHALMPKVIWKKLKFDRLRGSNLVERDFFDLCLETQGNAKSFLSEKFSVIVGNPPFESDMSNAGAKLDLIEQTKDSKRCKCPDNQAAYLFLEQSLGMVQPDMGRVCLIQPAGFLYNSNVTPFRTRIFDQHAVNTILDFTSVRQLYEADPKTVAVFAHASEPANDHKVNHWTFRRTVSVKERICFELDHYDRHQVSQQQAITTPYIWRANLLGGGRLVEMAHHIRSMRSLGDFVKASGWDSGEGFIGGSGGNPADFLTGAKFLPTEALDSHGIDESQIVDLPNKHFVCPRRPERYTPPLVLIKESSDLPIAYWDKYFLAYHDQIVGIHGNRDQAQALRHFCDTIRNNHDTYRFCCTLNGTKALVGRATAILKQDIDMLPYPEDLSQLEFSFWEKALVEDVLRYAGDYIRLGQNSDLLTKLANTSDLRKYAAIFIQMLGSVYENLKANDPVFLDGLVCQPFFFGDGPEVDWASNNGGDDLRQLVYFQKHENLRTMRIFRYYDKNTILIVKPASLRYWIRSTAIRDADETLVDLRGQGY
jgi:hypothetical protein